MKSKLFGLGAIKFLMKPHNYLGHNTYTQGYRDIRVTSLEQLSVAEFSGG